MGGLKPTSYQSEKSLMWTMARGHLVSAAPDLGGEMYSPEHWRTAAVSRPCRFQTLEQRISNVCHTHHSLYSYHLTAFQPQSTDVQILKADSETRSHTGATRYDRDDLWQSVTQERRLSSSGRRRQQHTGQLSRDRTGTERKRTECRAPSGATHAPSRAGLTSVLVEVGAWNGTPPQLEVFLIHHHLPWLLFASWIFNPFCLGFWFWGVALNSRAPKHTWHFLQPFHLINGSGEEKTNRCAGVVRVSPEKWTGHTKTYTGRCGFKTV